MGYPRRNLSDMSAPLDPEPSITVLELKDTGDFRAYDVLFPGEETVSFRVPFEAQSNGGPYPLHRGEVLLDNARTIDEANSRLRHEARKFAYAGANGRTVRPEYIKPALVNH